jgi:hypothetical protein
MLLHSSVYDDARGAVLPGHAAAVYADAARVAAWRDVNSCAASCMFAQFLLLTAAG